MWSTNSWRDAAYQSFSAAAVVGRCCSQGRFNVANQIGKRRLALFCRLGQASPAAAAIVDPILLEDLLGLRVSANKFPNRCIAIYLN